MPTRFTRGPIAVASIAVAGAALAGCSSSGSAAPHDAVAHLPSSGAATVDGSRPTTSTTSSDVPTRIRSKLFETDKETEANMIPWANCMRAHPVPVSPQGRPDPLTADSVHRFGPANKACADKLPLPPVEEDPANPKALTFNRAVAACIRRHGATDVIVENSNGYILVAFGDGQSTTIGLKYADRCQHSVANGDH